MCREPRFVLLISGYEQMNDITVTEGDLMIRDARIALLVFALQQFCGGELAGRCG